MQTFERNFLENLISLSPDSIVAIDRKGLITIFNQAAEKMFQRDARDVVGVMNIVELYPSREAARKIKKHIYMDCYGGPGRMENYITEVRSSNGKTIPIRLSATLIYEDGVEIDSAGFFRDETPRIKLEGKLQQMAITDGLTGLFNQRHF